MYYVLTAAGDCHLSKTTFKPMKARLHSDVGFPTVHHKINLQIFNQHVHSYFCLGVHVPPDVSIWGYMFICEGTHILELFFIVNV